MLEKSSKTQTFRAVEKFLVKAFQNAMLLGEYKIGMKIISVAQDVKDKCQAIENQLPQTAGSIYPEKK